MGGEIGKDGEIPRGEIPPGEIPIGPKRLIDGVWRVYYDGYWVKSYQAPADTLLAKKQLIGALTRRLFNHVEHGAGRPSVSLPGGDLWRVPGQARGCPDVPPQVLCAAPR
jgi:hypothetical protein